MLPPPLNIICFATFFKGGDFMRECHARGSNVILITKEKMMEEDWPRDVLADFFAVPNDAPVELFLDLVSHIAQTRKVDRIIALEEFDVVIAALAREHLCLNGMSSVTAKTFRDKLSMSVRARDAGITVPDFVAAINNEEVSEYLNRVQPPWVLKPRSSAAAIGIKKVDDRDALWHALEAAGDDRGQCVLEQFVPGDVYHVDSIVWNGQVVFAVAFKYGRPPMEVSHQGGLFITRRLPDESEEGRAVLAMNRTLQHGLGLRRGVSHTEFIRGAGEAGGAGTAGEADRSGGSGSVRLQPDPSFVFLETSARVGGAYIVDTVEAATGINLWRDWAKVEIAGEHGTYAVPAHQHAYAGIVLTLARQEIPDMAPYRDPEIAATIRKDFHAGLIVRSPDPQRVETLLADYTDRFYRDFFATAPPPERPLE